LYEETFGHFNKIILKVVFNEVFIVWNTVPGYQNWNS